MEIVMNTVTLLHPTSQAWLKQSSALAPHLDAFAAHLENGRYAVNTTRIILLASRSFRALDDTDLLAIANAR